MRKISLLLATVALASVGTVATVPSYAAKKKALAGPVVPKAFSAKEKASGAENHKGIMAEFGGVYQSAQTAYVDRIAKKMAVQSGISTNPNDFTVTFLNSPVNNAFATEGGYIYITRQLVALANSEAEMAGVLGHEWEHTFARHGRKRQKDATWKGLLGAGGTILGAVLGDRGGILGAVGGLLRENAQTVAQIWTLSFSRGQEDKADDGGILYLSRAGYDPKAMSSLLRSLALQTQMDQRVAGHVGGPIPEWASTHPEPEKRVARTALAAGNYPASTVRNVDEHMKQIDGMLYDDDPKDGVLDGNQFLYRDDKFKFSAPDGYGMANGATAVSINGNGGKGVFTYKPYAGDKAAYIKAAFADLTGKNPALPYGAVSETSVNGIPAFTSSATVAQKDGTSVLVTVFAYEMSAAKAYHFLTISPVSNNPFEAMYRSFSRMSDSEAAAIKARKIDVVTVSSSDTIASLSARMAYKNYQTERFMALNGMTSGAMLTKGQRVKIVTY